jgi:hypothetical protein
MNDAHDRLAGLNPDRLIELDEKTRKMEDGSMTDNNNERPTFDEYGGYWAYEVRAKDGMICDAILVTIEGAEDWDEPHFDCVGVVEKFPAFNGWRLDGVRAAHLRRPTEDEMVEAWHVADNQADAIQAEIDRMRDHLASARGLARAIGTDPISPGYIRDSYESE